MVIRPILAALLALLAIAPLRASTISVVAAENFYADAAAQIGGDAVSVKSVMSNPDQDPHLFESSPSTARLVAEARVAIVSGADYDPWMKQLLAATPSHARSEIDVADLIGKKPGDNPHIWYDPATMAALADALSKTLAQADPQRAGAFATSAAAFKASLAQIDAKIASMRQKYSGVAVAASEPVFGYMSDRLGLDMREQQFQLAVMNDAEPSASDVARFETDLKSGQIKVMIVNSQADDSAVHRLVDIAHAAGAPIVAVSELEPAGQTYQTWMLHQLDELDKALSSVHR